MWLVIFMYVNRVCVQIKKFFKMLLNLKNNPNSDADDHSGKTALENALREDTLSIQGVATLGVAAVAIGEEVGSEMTKRIFGQLVRKGHVQK